MEKSTIRNWLNHYFVNFAFSSLEQEDIIQDFVHKTKNKNNICDKVFLLFEKEVYEKSYGFVSNYIEKDEARRSRASYYALAMEVPKKNDHVYWWLRLPGRHAYYAVNVNNNGAIVKYTGWNPHTRNLGVRPALNLNFLSSQNYIYAGTVCSDGTVNEISLNSSVEEICMNFTVSKLGFTYQIKDRVAGLITWEELMELKVEKFGETIKLGENKLNCSCFADEVYEMLIKAKNKKR